jgi:transposase
VVIPALGLDDHVRRGRRGPDEILDADGDVVLQITVQAGGAAELIELHFRVRFHVEHVRKMLKRRLKWTSQKPQRRAKERDGAAIDH